jgi:hypothetical protein
VQSENKYKEIYVTAEKSENFLGRENIAAAAFNHKTS